LVRVAISQGGKTAETGG